jgi:transposase
LICDGRGIPLAIELTGANCHDSTQALPLLDAIPPLQGPRGRPRSRPDCILGDRAYDARKIRRALRARHISPLLAMRNTENGSGLGRWRWVIERVFAWLNPSSPAVREKSRYAQGTSIARVRADLLEFPTGSLSVIQVFQTDKPQMSKLTRVSFMVVTSEAPRSMHKPEKHLQSGRKGSRC